MHTEFASQLLDFLRRCRNEGLHEIVQDGDLALIDAATFQLFCERTADGHNSKSPVQRPAVQLAVSAVEPVLRGVSMIPCQPGPLLVQPQHAHQEMRLYIARFENVRLVLSNDAPQLWQGRGVPSAALADREHPEARVPGCCHHRTLTWAAPIRGHREVHGRQVGLWNSSQSAEFNQDSRRTRDERALD